MTAIGSLMFCNDCGNLLEASTSLQKKTLTCDVCGASCKDVSQKTIVTKSKPSDFPSELRARRSQVQNVDREARRDAMIRVTCEGCGNEEVNYYTQQLRSADEGTTVFYSCPNCGKKWNENN